MPFFLSVSPRARLDWIALRALDFGFAKRGRRCVGDRDDSVRTVDARLSPFVAAVLPLDNQTK